MRQTQHVSDSDLVAYGTLAEGSRRRRIETHLATCPACRERLAAFQEIDRLIRQHYPLVDDPIARAELLARMRMIYERQESAPRSSDTGCTNQETIQCEHDVTADVRPCTSSCRNCLGKGM
jgi:anti-sigma factor RsiW